MARYLILALALAGCALADDSGYAAASSGYSQPEPQSYVTESSKFDLSKLTELLPFFLAVFVAIIFAQLLFPLLGALFTAKAGLLGPLGDTGINLINGILGTWDLALCTTNPLAVAGTGNGRSIVSPDNLAIISDLIVNAIEKYEA